MSSAGVSDAGKFSGGRTNFSHMCTLLSQYLKERGSFGDLKIDFKEPKGPATETMNLFPMKENSGQDSGSGSTSAPGTAPMTIFYGGRVMVFGDFPAEKARDIIDLATESSAARSIPSASAGVRLTAEPPLDSDLPIARKNSLARFLEKRKDRITAHAPYPSAKPRRLLPEPALHLH